MKKSLVFVIIFISVFSFISCNVDVNIAEQDAGIPEVTLINAPEVIHDEIAAQENTAHTIITEETLYEPAPITPTTEPATEAAQTPAAEEPPAPVVQDTRLPPRSSTRIPIFMYHTSSEDNPGGLPELYVRPSEFERQIRHLSENGYTFVTFDDWFNLHNIEKPVFITFDDGYEANFTEIFPIIQRYNARITIFLALDNIERENFTVEMIREMSDSGLVKFESHTITHVDLTGISSDDARLTRELRDSKAMIEEITGKPVLALAYPGGRFNARVVERAREYYLFAVSTISGKHDTSIHGDFEIRRLRVNRSTSLNAFINMLES